MDALGYVLYGLLFVLLLFIVLIIVPRGPIMTQLAKLLTSDPFFYFFLCGAVMISVTYLSLLPSLMASISTLTVAVLGAPILIVALFYPLRAFVKIYSLDVRRDPAEDLRRYEPRQVHRYLLGFLVDEEFDEEGREHSKADSSSITLEDQYVVTNLSDWDEFFLQDIPRDKKVYISHFKSAAQERLRIKHVIISDEPDLQGRPLVIHLLEYIGDLLNYRQFITRFESGDVVLTGTWYDPAHRQTYSPIGLATPEKLHSVVGFGAFFRKDFESLYELHRKHIAAVVPDAKPVADTKEERHNFVAWYEKWRLEHQCDIGEMVREGSRYYWTRKGAWRARRRIGRKSLRRQAKKDLERIL